MLTYLQQMTISAARLSAELNLLPQNLKAAAVSPLATVCAMAMPFGILKIDKKIHKLKENITL